MMARHTAVLLLLLALLTTTFVCLQVVLPVDFESLWKKK
jgi:hypothetical protein